MLLDGRADSGVATRVRYTLRGHEWDVVELLENHYPGREVGQAFQPDLQCLSFVPW